MQSHVSAYDFAGLWTCLHVHACRPCMQQSHARMHVHHARPNLDQHAMGHTTSNTQHGAMPCVPPAPYSPPALRWPCPAFTCASFSPDLRLATHSHPSEATSAYLGPSHTLHSTSHNPHSLTLSHHTPLIPHITSHHTSQAVLCRAQPAAAPQLFTPPRCGPRVMPHVHAAAATQPVGAVC